MVARVAVVAAAIVLAGFAAIDLHDSNACSDGARRIFVFGFTGREPVSDGFVDAFAEDCRGSHWLAIASDTLLSRERYDQAARLAREAIRREPDNHEGWVALARTLRARGLDRAADEAMREVRRLNPRFDRAPG